MTNIVHLVIWSAIALAMAGALFGLAMARMFWANDLRQAQQLSQSCGRIQASMERTIAAQSKTIDLKNQLIVTLQQHLGRTTPLQ